MQIFIVLFLIIAVLLVIFTLLNSSDITLNLFFWEFKDVPLVLVLLSTIVLGFILGFLYFYPKIWKARSEKKKIVKENARLNQLYIKSQEELKLKKGATLSDGKHPEGISLDAGVTQ